MGYEDGMGASDRVGRYYVGSPPWDPDFKYGWQRIESTGPFKKTIHVLSSRPKFSQFAATDRVCKPSKHTRVLIRDSWNHRQNWISSETARDSC